MTKIEWTDESWNVITGCEEVSLGCAHCYARLLSARLAAIGQKKYQGVAERVKGEARWTGDVFFHPAELERPLRWRKPRRVFVNSMSDTFHESVTDEQIASIFGVMAACPNHTFQVLTKRPDRALEWFGQFGAGAIPSVYCTLKALGLVADECLDLTQDRLGHNLQHRAVDYPWPLPNVWLGTSVEDQATAAERIPHLLACPAAVRFVSYEPALGPVNFRSLDADKAGHKGDWYWVDALTGRQDDMGRPCRDAPSSIDWIIAGGESGPGARPCDVRWITDTVEQCREVGVPCFVKQLGANSVWREHVIRGRTETWTEKRRPFKDRKGGDWSEWPSHLRVREYPAGQE